MNSSLFLKVNLSKKENITKNEPIISSGISKFRPETDNTFKAVFYRADKLMYARKELLKEHKS